MGDVVFDGFACRLPSIQLLRYGELVLWQIARGEAQIEQIRIHSACSLTGLLMPKHGHRIYKRRTPRRD